MQFFTRSWLPTVGLTLHDAMKLVFLISRCNEPAFCAQHPSTSPAPWGDPEEYPQRNGPALGSGLLVHVPGFGSRATQLQ